MMESGAHQPCAACGDDAHAACRACSYALCRACLDEDVAEGRTACARCAGEYAAFDTAHAKGSAVEEEEEQEVENQLAAEGLRGRVTVASQLTDRQEEVSHARTMSSMSGLGSELNDESGKPIWKNRVDSWKEKKNEKKASAKKTAAKAQVPPVEEQIMDEKDLTDAYEPLSKIIPISKNKLTPYRAVIIMRLVVLGLFFHYRITNPVDSAFGLWLTSVICEIWFGFSWILDQFPKWCPVNRETYVDRLIARYGDGEDSGLAPVDFFVSTVDPLKEPPLITANTVLSILAVDYPVEKVSCYVSDDGASMLTFESLAETAEFARRWVPFCKMYATEPRICSTSSRRLTT